MIIAIFIVLLLAGIAFTFSISKLVTHLRLLLIKTIWNSYDGTILESNGEMIMEERHVVNSGPIRKFSTSVKVSYQVNEQTFETFFTERAFMYTSLSETKTTFKIHFPVGKKIPVYINANDHSEIEIDENKIKKNKIGLAVDVILYMIYVVMGIAMIGVGIFGLISQLK